jgi:hypothetical protein
MAKPSIPNPLWNWIQRLIDENPELGYRSASELIIEQARERAEEIEARQRRKENHEP